MTDKRPHIKPEELAGLIRQYLAGELDDKAMHALERQALDDPFLADALEGYALHTPEQTVHQEELAARLSERIATRGRRVVPMYYRWAAAAAILLLMFSAGWFLWEQQRKAPIASVNTQKPAQEAAPVLSEYGDTAPVLANADHLAKKSITPAPAPAAVPPVADKSEEIAPAAETADKEVPTERRNKITADDTAMTSIVPYAAAPVKAAEPEYNSNRYSARPSVPNKEKQFSIRGQGNLLLDSQNHSLNEVVITSYGIQKKRAVMGATTTIQRDSISNVESFIQGKVAGVAVESSRTQGSVRGTTEASYNGNEDMAYREPAPVTGQTAFENYLRTKTVNPDNKYNGTVRVSFLVMPDGTLQDFKIIRHLNDACDAEAIRVIKEGPAWAPASDRKPAKVKVRVKFTVEKDR